MNRKSLTTAILAGITGIAGIVSVSNAVHINPDNTGQVLIYPYYNTQGDNVTLISVVNTTGDGKAIKVRFLEGNNSAEVLDFNLYMSPFDVWTASIVPTGAGGSKFVTNDNSCTVPEFFDPALGTSDGAANDLNGFSSFVGDEYQFVDNGPQGIERTNEGYVELIEMGVLNNTGSGGPNTLAAATHNQSGPVDANGNPLPSNCGLFTAGFFSSPVSQGFYIDNIDTELTPPTGGLFGDGVVINVAGARAFGYNATALDGFFVPDVTDVGVAGVSLHSIPGSIDPSLSDAFPFTSTTYLSTGNAPTLVTDSWDFGAQAVIASLMADQVMNQFSIEADIAGGTEWVITHPAKRPATFAGFVGGSAEPPFTNTFPTFNPNNSDTNACEPAAVTIFDRNEGTTGSLPVPSPGGFSDGSLVTVLCFEVNVVSFGGSPVLDSALTAPFPDLAAAGFESGWAQIAFNTDDDIAIGDAGIRHQLINDNGNDYSGLPVVGFAVRSANAPGAQFGTAFEHALGRIITN